MSVKSEIGEARAAIDKLTELIEVLEGKTQAVKTAHEVTIELRYVGPKAENWQIESYLSDVLGDSERFVGVTVLS